MAEFEDDYPVLQQSSAPQDDYPVIDPTTIHASNVPRPPEDDYPVFNPPDKPRGIQERATDAFKESYKPLIGESSTSLFGLGSKDAGVVKQIAPDFTAKHPTIAGVLQNVLSGSPLGWADRAASAVMAAPSALAGVGAGVAEKLGLRSQEADRLQRDLDVLGKAAMAEAGRGDIASFSQARGVQLGDIGKQGLSDLKKQGQTPGPSAAPGVAQDPNPPARSTVADFQNKATLGDGLTEKGGENLNTRDYGKKAPGETGASGVNITENGVDPTVASTLKAETTAPPDLATKAAEEQAGTTAQEQPPTGARVPSAEDAAQAQARIAERKAGTAPLKDEPGLAPTREIPAELDHASANRLINQRMLLNSEAAKRGVTPEVLKQQAYDVINRERATPAPETMDIPAGAVELPEVEVRPEGTPVEPSPEALAERADPGVAPQAAGAAATPSAALPAPPATPRTRVVDALRNAYNSFLDYSDRQINEAQMLTSPMAARSATARARVIAKDQANAIRRIDQEWAVAHDHITKNFDPESWKRMWDAADEENVMRQRGETSEHMGVATLTPEERALTDSFQPKARELWDMARDIGWVHGEGLPYYTPRMFEGIVQKVEGATALDAKGRNIQTTTPGMKTRKYMEAEESEAAAQKHFGEEAKIVRDIRTMPLALAKMEKALVNRVMIKKIEDVGRQIGKQTAIESTSSPGPGWFTMSDNPAFYTYRPRYEIADTPTYRAAAEARSGVAVPEGRVQLMDRNGNPVIDRVPIWIPGEFEGPLKSIMNKPATLAERGLMQLKGKTMSLIMNSPLIHNAVEWGRALPTMPGKMITFQTYFEGNAAKRGVPYTGTTRYVRDWASGKLEPAPRNASPTMIEAIDHGLVPIGKRFFNQDITAVMETPDLTPGRSLTAKALALVPDLYNPAAGTAVKRAVDKAGDFWHNTLLWDRIGDLQMGLYVNAKKDLIARGLDPKMASYTAAHIANRYAGALPSEAMSNGARRIANFMMFSRTFTLGNLGVLKDMVTGLPRDVQAQMMRDLGTIDPRATNYVKSIAQRKAIMAVGLDVGLMYIGNSILQSAFNLLQDDNTLGKEGEGYVRRFKDALERLKEDNPLALLNPVTSPVMLGAQAIKDKDPSKLFRSAATLPLRALGTVESLSATSENEPGKHDRIKVGETKDGRGIYMRNPIGKIGEEFVGYLAGPLDMLKRKMGTIARPLWQVLSNDKGFGQKIYDPNADMLSGKQIESAINVGKVFFSAQAPEGQIRAGKDLITGQGNQGVNALQALGPLGGLTFSLGHPGGPAAGELARYTEGRKFELGPQLTEIRKMVRDGKTDEAIDRMNELQLEPGLRKSILNPRMSPRQMKDLYRHGAPEQVERFQRRRGE